ncbi:MAG TPA: NAD(P)/FAD-dependent oxidoreductase [Candidatus Brachybacterium merdavium]|uniref:NAD(P)/FAD-dependent oxidoreductase n=1 Tax=Candidatus Brachybacterium merdavium TaxID=2838513 RepID=A0A9D2LD52_9MICO|nr:NAD(P)/FAD-dependent oxidoreductase [Candidatus Brachybacterium merdavium]
MGDRVRTTDVVVIGAGQAGLSAIHHLLRRGVRPADEIALAASPDPDRLPRVAGPQDLSFLALDAEPGPGGAWRHRWDSLTMATVNGISELPGMPAVDHSPGVPSNQAIPDYFADFEHQHAAPVERPVRVLRVEEDPVAIGTPRADVASGADEAPRPLLVTSERTDGGRRAPIRARAVINATGTWTRPFLPTYPGAADFEGNHLHTVDYTRAEDFTGQRVAVVGGGISALGFLLELAEVARTRWYTRHEPVFQDGPFTPEEGRRAVAGVAERVQAGLPVQSVVSATGLIWTPALRDADARGVLERHEMFARIVPDGVVETDGTLTQLDVILWATGFRHELRHLRGLRLHGPLGGIRMDGTAVASDPRIHLLGYGPSASTIGANRAGRTAVTTLLRTLGTS